MLKRTLFILILGLLLLPIINEAQEKKAAIKLLDDSSEEPIIGAHFKYNTQIGVSNIDGIIFLRYKVNSNLELSHLQYGKWQLSDSQVLDAIETGVIYKAEKPVNLQPVTVIALHPKSNEQETFGLSVKDKLSHDGGSVLAQTAAINTIRKGGNYGFDPILRGFKYDQLNIVIDGAQCASAACPNRMDPPISQIAPNMMEKVEIFKGPHSLRYGSSFGGTINFVSSSPKFSAKNKTYGRISGSLESNGGIYRTEGMIGYRIKNFDIGILGSFSKGNNYTDGKGLEIPSAFQRASFGTKIGIKLNNDHLLNISLTRNIADNVDFAALPMDLASDKTTLFNVKYKYQINGNFLRSWNTAFFGTFVDHRMDNLSKNLNPRKVNAITNADTKNFGGRTEGSWLFKKGRLYAGSDFRVEQADGIRTRKFLMGKMAGKTLKDNVWNGGRITKIAAFGEYHHLFDSFNLIFSGRVEYNNAKATNLNENFKVKNNETTSTDINPSLSVGVLKKINEDITLGLWLGRAQRSGSITERYINSFPVGLDPYDLFGNPSLEPEINNQLDFTALFKTKNTIIDFNAFVSFLNDYISSEIDENLTPTMPSSPGVRRYKNIDKAIMMGFEINWNQNLAYGLQHNLAIAYTFGEDQVINKPLPEIAPLDFRYAVNGSYFENKVRPEIQFRHVIAQERVSLAFGENTTPSFSTIDAKITYQYNKLIGATFGVQNLFDETYYEHLSRNVLGTDGAIYAPGRNLYLSLIIDLM
ncbi:MAG: TonB-dependent receptor [Ignavibacteriae bacterium]|nr:MAG: TonB-dependent receptor [Ignavibacteriota bacterium]